MANNIREIITQAVIAKGKKRTLNKYPFSIEGYDKILGCWITNHRYNAAFKDGKPVVLGTFEANCKLLKRIRFSEKRNPKF